MIAALASGCGGAAPSTTPDGEPVDYFMPLAVGNTWVYEESWGLTPGLIMIQGEWVFVEERSGLPAIGRWDRREQQTLIVMLALDHRVDLDVWHRSEREP